MGASAMIDRSKRKSRAERAIGPTTAMSSSTGKPGSGAKPHCDTIRSAVGGPPSAAELSKAGNCSTMGAGTLTELEKSQQLPIWAEVKIRLIATNRRLSRWRLRASNRRFEPQDHI